MTTDKFVWCDDRFVLYSSVCLDLVHKFQRLTHICLTCLICFH